MNENNEIPFPEIYILFLRWPKNYQDLPGWMLFFNKTKKPSKTPVSQKLSIVLSILGSVFFSHFTRLFTKSSAHTQIHTIPKMLTNQSDSGDVNS